MLTGDLCVDSRPAVRKSAGQTLFSTISAHGGLLHQPTWQAVLWQVRKYNIHEKYIFTLVQFCKERFS